MKLSRKGFTLVELLSIIVILGLVTGITITSVLGVLSNAREKSNNLTVTNIESQAEKYIYEGFADSEWMPETETTEYQCVTVEDLIEEGYFKVDILSDTIRKENAVKVTRNRNTKAIINKELDLENHLTNECSQHEALQGGYITCVIAPTGWSPTKFLGIYFNAPKVNGSTHEFKYEVTALDDIKFGGEDGKPKTWETWAKNEKINSSTTFMKRDIRNNASVYASMMYDGRQIASTVCRVDKIDDIPPIVDLSANNQTLTCDLYDDETGIVRYKICKDEECGNDSWQEIAATNYKSVTSSVTSSGTYKCYGQDQAGNESEDTIEVQSQYELIYHCGEGVTCSNLPSPNPVTQTTNDFKISSTIPIRNGYRFDYWETKVSSYHFCAQGSSGCYSSLRITVGNTLTLYAHWTSTGTPPSSSSPSNSSSPQNGGGNKLYKQYCKNYYEACKVQIPLDDWNNTYNIYTKCTYTDLEEDTYWFYIYLKEIRQNKRRCNDDTPSPPRASTEKSPRALARKTIADNLLCPEGINEYQYIPKFPVVSHSYYGCVYEKKASNDLCPSGSTVNTLVKPSTGNWYKCVYK